MEEEVHFVCANDVEDTVSLPEFDNVYDGMCGFDYYNFTDDVFVDDNYFDAGESGLRKLALGFHPSKAKNQRLSRDGHHEELDHSHGDHHDENQEFEYICEPTKEKLIEHKSVCEDDVGGKYITADLVCDDLVSYINYPICVRLPECIENVALLSTELGEYYDAMGCEVSISDSEHDDESEDGHDDGQYDHFSFHIKSSFPSAHEWCIQPEVYDDHTTTTLEPRTDIIIRTCEDGLPTQEWAVDEFGRIYPALAPYLCITKVAFDRLELDYCGSSTEDNSFMHNLFDDTIVLQKATDMVFTISSYDPDENDLVVLAKRHPSLQVQEWKLQF